MNQNTNKRRFPFLDDFDKGISRLVNEVLQHESSSCNSPQLSVYEHDDSYVVQCDLPGVKLDDIELHMENGILQISGKRKDPGGEGVNVTLNERSFSDFSRQLKLGKDVDPENVEAEFGNGVLSVTVPKSESVRSRQIPIRKPSE